MISIPARLKAQTEQFRRILEQFECKLRVALPGIIQSFDTGTETVTVQLAIKENILVNDVPTPTAITILEDVPLVLPRAGNFVLTMPIQAGDECLVIFADMAIDSWWQSGGVQGQVMKRRHHLSDAFAIPGTWSQPRNIANYDASNAQLRSLDGTVKITLKPAEIDIEAPTVKVTGAAQVNIVGAGNTTIEGKNFLSHKHSGVQSGGSQTGGVV